MSGMMLDLAAPEFISDRDPGDEHEYGHPHEMTRCPECGCPAAPEPSREERERIFADADFVWFPPEGIYLHFGFGLMGGGCGSYCVCDRCGFFHKQEVRGE